MKDKNISIKQLKKDSRNANLHSKEGMQMLKDGIIKNGLGRSILLSADNEIIAGNGVAETAESIGIDKVRVIETDGTEIIAVKRTDVNSGTREFYEMALSDNIISKKNIVMDTDVVDAICEDYDIEPIDLTEKVTKPINPDSNAKDGIFPLSIVLLKSDYAKWQNFKKSYKIKGDTEAFMKIFDEQLIQ